MDDFIHLIVLADDPLARAGLSALLGTLPGFFVEAQGDDSRLLEAAAGEMDASADVIVWDMGWEVAEHIEDERLERNIPVLALVAEKPSAAIAWRLGCRAVLSRQADEEQLAAALVAVAGGLAVFSPLLVESLQSPANPVEVTLGDLTPRESEVLTLLAEGLTNKAIALRLTISEHTVKFHVNAILGKLGAQSRTDAVVRATRLGLIAL
ncbi:MAG: response regulator transcription factor [Candidatus Promineofilum sp.]|nr:response regulator transcription factor [Promineifilum sp.]